MAQAPLAVRFSQPNRAPLLRRALHLALLTVGWNVVEGVIAVWAAIQAGSVALLGFGLDSFVESASGVVIVWRTLAERRARDLAHVETIESRAGKLVAATLVLLALFIAYDAGTSLLARDEPDVSVVGIVLLVVSVIVMQWLARAKRQNAQRLGSRSIQADAFQTSTCLYLSIAALVGIGLNALFGWWWADPLAALVMVVPLGLEAREAWEGEGCGCDTC